MDKAGRFVAIGSGIKGISHLTLESVAWIKEADIVCYCVSDPATVVWLKQNAKAEQDLYSLYGDDKKRIDTYHEMVETMCNHVRQGKTVAGVPLRGPEEVPTREEALRMYTLGSAWFARDEDKRGSLVVGKLADLAVLSKDYMKAPLEDIGRIESMLTMVGGRIVYAAGPYAGFEESPQR